MSLELDRIYCMDCLKGIKQLQDNSVDAVVTDPPYELGFMGKKWDASGISYNVGMWSEVLRVMKPGGHLLSFGGSRTYHRMACAVEDAGFEIRDMINWIYGSGFPKSLDISKALDKIKGAKREITGRKSKAYPDSDCWGIPNKNISECKSMFNAGERGDVGGMIPVTSPVTSEAKEWSGWGTALKPAHEPIVLARKSLSEKTVAENVLKWGTGGLNIDGCRIPLNGNDYKGLGGGGVHGIGKKIDNKVYGEYEGRVDINHSLGRFPANLIHNGSQEIIEVFPETKSGKLKPGHKQGGSNMFSNNEGTNRIIQNYGNDSGSASRFFYCAKASKTERDMGLEGLPEKESKWLHDDGRKIAKPLSDPRMDKPQQRFPIKNNHPTVKPLALMEYLIKLITKENQVVLDPFIGSGTTALACKKLNRRFIGFEISPEYCMIANKRLANIPVRLETFLEDT